MTVEATTSDVIALPFEVPDDWGTPRLSARCEFVRDGDWIETKDQGGADYRLLQISNIGVGRFIETGKYRWITQETFRRLNCTEVLPDDVLVARMPEPTGRAWCVPELPWRTVTAVDIAIVRPKRDELDPRFLAYFLNSPACLATVRSLTTGTTRLRIRRADIERLQIPLPSLSEQRAIADVLGALDDKIELSRRITQTLEESAKALFKSWFVDFDPIRAKAAGRELSLPPTLAEQFPASFEQSSLDQLPAGWQPTPLGDLCRRVAMGPFGSDITTDNFVESGVPVIRGRNLAHDFVDEGFVFVSEAKADELRNANAFPGDIVVTHRGTLGQVGLIPRRSQYPRYVVSQSQMVLSVDPDKATSRYVFEFLRSTGGQHALLANTSQTGVPAIARPTTSVKAIRVLKPSGPILAAFDRLLDPYTTRRDRASDEMRTLASLHEALLPKLISGQVNVMSRGRLTEANE